MELKTLLRGVELFDGLTDVELDEIGALCQKKSFAKGEFLAIEGEKGDEFFVVTEGAVEVLVGDNSKVLINLGIGQLIGEMSMVDQGPRSASVRAIHDPTVVQVIRHEDFQALCQRNTHIGYVVMYNMAADLSFKLRHRNLSEI